LLNHRVDKGAFSGSKNLPVVIMQLFAISELI